VRLGVPLLDVYLEFLAGRCRPNTVLAVAYDLKVFFRGRRLDGQALFAPGENIHLTNVRSGRDGITYDAGRLDLVLAGTAPLSRLARPRLQELGLAEWSRVIAGQSGLVLELSSAGRRAEMLRQLWDGREDSVQSMTGELLPVLHAFRLSYAESSRAYPGGEGVVLLNGVREGYLTFAGMVKFAGEGIDKRGLRDGIDALAARGVVRRGLVLGCDICGRPSFIAIGNLAQVNQCPRCGSANELAQRQWRLPAEEPSWYYDLHPVARELLANHGEVPLLLSRHLRSVSRRYDDAPELELRDASANPVAEADLIAVSDDDLIVADGSQEQRRARRQDQRDKARSSEASQASRGSRRQPDNPRHHRSAMERFEYHGNPQRGHRACMASRPVADRPPHNQPWRRPGRGSTTRY
jgi:hypothetical protein